MVGTVSRKWAMMFSTGMPTRHVMSITQMWCARLDSSGKLVHSKSPSVLLVAADADDDDFDFDFELLPLLSSVADTVLA